MYRIIATTIALLLLGTASAQAGIREEFKALVDEFDDTEVYYPSTYSNIDEYWDDCMVEYRKELNWSNNCIPLVQKYDNGGFGLMLNIQTKNEDSILADRIYLKCEDEKFSIPYDPKEIESTLSGEYYTLRCFNSSGDPQVFMPYYGNLTIKHLLAILESDTLKFRVGQSAVIEFDDLRLEELKNFINLFLFLTVYMEDDLGENASTPG